LTIGETFGEEELISKLKRNVTVKCVSTFADVYILKKKVLEFFVVEFVKNHKGI